MPSSDSSPLTSPSGARHTDGELRSFLAGEPAVAAVERDPSPGRPPRGVDG